jgi:subtilisin family serine protease
MDKWFRTHCVIFCIAATPLVLAPTSASAADPMLDQQWALATPAATGAEQAWSRSSGQGVVVAVLDSGVQVDHPDLAGALWTNPGEIPGNGRDDDNDGIVDDVHGANMLTKSNAIADDNGHGTHVAGIIAARKDNGIGGAGIAPDATIMPVKVLDSSMRGNTTALALGIRYAVDQGARILNVSINGDESSGLLADAVAYAASKGASVVASAGNNSRSLDAQPSYPASLPGPAVLTVAATVAGGGLAAISNFGPQSVELAAPGDHVLSTALGSGYEWRQGTSMAAPFVSGSLALLAAARPDLDQAALRAALLRTARRPGSLTAVVAEGALDVGRAMISLTGSGSGPIAASEGDDASVTRLKLSVGRHARAGRRATLRWSATAAGTVLTWRVSLDGRVVAKVAADAALRVRRTIRTARTHRWRVVGFDADGTKVVSATRSFKVARR